MTVDTDSRKLSAVDIYEDASKLSKQSSTLDAVGDFCDDVKVYFVGSNPPAEEDAVELVAAYDGTSSSVLLTEDGATTFFIKAGGERGEDDDGVYYIFRPNFTHETLQTLFESKATLNLTGAFVVTNTDSGKHVEFQFPISAKRGVYNTTLGIAPDGTGDYSAILVVRLTWEEYCALDAAGELSDTTVYMVSGAPTEEGESGDVATETQTALQAEIERATAAENALDEKISTATETATAANTTATEALATAQAASDGIATATETANAATETAQNAAATATEAKSIATETETALQAEIERATAAENTNASAISTETERATNAETDLSASITAETTRATAAETTLAEELDDEIAARQTAESNFVTLDGAQTITGAKTFSATQYIYSSQFALGAGGITFSGSGYSFYINFSASGGGITFSGENGSISFNTSDTGGITFSGEKNTISVPYTNTAGGTYTFWQNSGQTIADAQFSRTALTLGAGEGAGYVLTLNGVDVGTAVATNTANIATNATAISALQSDVETLQTAASGTATAISDLQTAVNTNAENIETLQDELPQISAVVNTNAENIAAETAARESADAELEAKIGTAQTTADAALEAAQNAGSGSGSGSVEIDTSNFVTLDGEQTITGAKTFTAANFTIAPETSESVEVDVGNDTTGERVHVDIGENASGMVTLYAGYNATDTVAFEVGHGAGGAVSAWIGSDAQDNVNFRVGAGMTGENLYADVGKEASAKITATTGDFSTGGIEIHEGYRATNGNIDHYIGYEAGGGKISFSVGYGAGVEVTNDRRTISSSSPAQIYVDFARNNASVGYIDNISTAVFNFGDYRYSSSSSSLMDATSRIIYGAYKGTLYLGYNVGAGGNNIYIGGALRDSGDTGEKSTANIYIGNDVAGANVAITGTATLNGVDVGSKLSELEARIAALEAAQS